MIVGSRLRDERIKKGLSQEELGELIGVSKSAICLYESEKRNPTIDNVMEFIYIFGVSADYLIGNDSIIEIENEEVPKYRTVTKEEMAFLEGLRNDKFLAETLLQDHKRGIELIKKRIG